MNTQKRIRPESIAAANDRQTKTPVQVPAWRFNPKFKPESMDSVLLDRIAGADASDCEGLGEICDHWVRQLTGDYKTLSGGFDVLVAPFLGELATQDRARLAAVYERWAGLLYAEQEKRMATEAAARAALEEAAPDRGRYAPFGMLEPTDEVQSARFHIQSTYKDCLARQCDDAACVLLDLAACMEGNHALSIEREALLAISSGLDGINKYWKDHADRLTGAETWMKRKLKGGDIALKDAWDVLFEARAVIADNPASVEFFQMIEAMFLGNNIMHKIGRYLNSI